MTVTCPDLMVYGGMSCDPEFARQITEHQQRIYGYIYSLVGNSVASWDVLQETNLVLWKKQSDFQLGTRFDAWAFTVARFQVMAYFRDKKRDRLSVLTPELLDAFADDPEVEAAQYDERLLALRQCRQKLGGKSRRLVEMFYDNECSMKEIAEEVGTSASAVKQAIFRVRRSLLDCIEATPSVTTK